MIQSKQLLIIPHEPKVVQGWTVMVDKALLSGDKKEFGKEALTILSEKLREIKAVVSPERVKDLQKVRIYMDDHHPLERMQYHPGAEWLKDNGYDPAMVRCVHIPRISEVLGKFLVNQQPWAVLHELAHAYHDQFLGFNDAKIERAYQDFKAKLKPEEVLHINGSTRKHYALTNSAEFFAEMTEAYFGTNDFFPFVRGELKTSFPDVYQLMEEVWGK